jgi:hypothetical protein
VSVGALADLNKVAYFAHWLVHPMCPSAFKDIFVPWRCIILPRPGVSAFKHAIVFRGDNRSPMSSVQPPNLYHRYTQNRKSQFMEYVKLRYAHIKLRDEHQQRVDAYMDTMPAGVVGIHVRRTDLGHQHGESDERLCGRLNKELEDDPAAQFLLCADNPGPVKMLQERYGERIHWRKQCLNEQYRRGCRNGPVVEAAIDLICLSRTSRILGTRASSFSDMAGAIGNIPMHRV